MKILVLNGPNINFWESVKKAFMAIRITIRW